MQKITKYAMWDTFRQISHKKNCRIMTVAMPRAM